MGQGQDNGRRQQAGGFGQRNRGAVQVGGPVTQGAQRPFHRGAQIVGRVGDGFDPRQAHIGWQDDPGNIAVIGPRFQCFRPPAGNRQ